MIDQAFSPYYTILIKEQNNQLLEEQERHRLLDSFRIFTFNSSNCMYSIWYLYLSPDQTIVNRIDGLEAH
jgi:hypothetical protein